MRPGHGGGDRGNRRVRGRAGRAGGPARGRGAAHRGRRRRGGRVRARSGGAARAGARAVSFGVSSGLFHGVATLGIKAIPGELAGHPGAFAAALALVGSPYPYLAFGMSAAGLLVFQTGLQRCRVSIVGPVSSVTGSAFFMVAGTWLFGERLPADPARLALRLAGIVVAVLVVLVLSTRPAGDSPRPDPAQRDPGAAAAAGPA